MTLLGCTSVHINTLEEGNMPKLLPDCILAKAADGRNIIFTLKNVKENSLPTNLNVPYIKRRDARDLLEYDHIDEESPKDQEEKASFSIFSWWKQNNNWKKGPSPKPFLLRASSPPKAVPDLPPSTGPPVSSNSPPPTDISVSSSPPPLNDSSVSSNPEFLTDLPEIPSNETTQTGPENSSALPSDLSTTSQSNASITTETTFQTVCFVVTTTPTCAPLPEFQTPSSCSEQTITSTSATVSNTTETALNNNTELNTTDIGKMTTEAEITVSEILATGVTQLSESSQSSQGITEESVTEAQTQSLTATQVLGVRNTRKPQTPRSSSVIRLSGKEVSPDVVVPVFPVQMGTPMMIPITLSKNASVLYEVVTSFNNLPFEHKEESGKSNEMQISILNTPVKLPKVQEMPRTTDSSEIIQDNAGTTERRYISEINPTMATDKTEKNEFDNFGISCATDIYVTNPLPQQTNVTSFQSLRNPNPSHEIVSDWQYTTPISNLFSTQHFFNSSNIEDEVSLPTGQNYLEEIKQNNSTFDQNINPFIKYDYNSKINDRNLSTNEITSPYSVYPLIQETVLNLNNTENKIPLIYSDNSLKSSEQNIEITEQENTNLSLLNKYILENNQSPLSTNNWTSGPPHVIGNSERFPTNKNGQDYFNNKPENVTHMDFTFKDNADNNVNIINNFITTQDLDVTKYSTIIFPLNIDSNMETYQNENQLFIDQKNKEISAVTIVNDENEQKDLKRISCPENTFNYKLDSNNSDSSNEIQKKPNTQRYIRTSLTNNAHTYEKNDSDIFIGRPHIKMRKSENEMNNDFSKNTLEIRLQPKVVTKKINLFSPYCKLKKKVREPEDQENEMLFTADRDLQLLPNIQQNKADETDEGNWNMEERGDLSSIEDSIIVDENPTEEREEPNNLKESVLSYVVVPVSRHLGKRESDETNSSAIAMHIHLNNTDSSNLNNDPTSINLIKASLVNKDNYCSYYKLNDTNLPESCKNVTCNAFDYIPQCCVRVCSYGESNGEDLSYQLPIPDDTYSSLNRNCNMTSMNSLGSSVPDDKGALQINRIIRNTHPESSLSDVIKFHLMHGIFAPDGKELLKALKEAKNQMQKVNMEFHPEVRNNPNPEVPASLPSLSDFHVLPKKQPEIFSETLPSDNILEDLRTTLWQSLVHNKNKPVPLIFDPSFEDTYRRVRNHEVNNQLESIKENNAVLEKLKHETEAEMKRLAELEMRRREEEALFNKEREHDLRELQAIQDLMHREFESRKANTVVDENKYSGIDLSSKEDMLQKSNLNMQMSDPSFQQQSKVDLLNMDKNMTNINFPELNIKNNFTEPNQALFK